MRIAIVGGGSIGAALSKLCIKKKVVARKNLSIIEINNARREMLAKEIGCRVASSPDVSVRAADIVVIAVKPKDALFACELVRPFLKKNQIVLSVMAGVCLATLRKALKGHMKLIRCMSNIPVQVGLGMTVCCAAAGVQKRDLALVDRLLAATGLFLRVDDEKLIDATTAVSGSGPAYVYYFLEQLIDAAIALGFSESEAQMLARQTFEGAIYLLDESRLSAAELRRQVTTERGTTAAAFEVFEKGKLGKVFQAGVKRAYARSRELGLENTRRPK